MESNATLLEKEDKRFYAIDLFNTGLSMIATTEKVNNQNISFGLPTSTGIFLSSALHARNKIKNTAIEAYFNHHDQGTWPDDHALLFDFFEAMSSQIIFAYTAIETFANVMISQKTPDKHIFKIIKKSKITSCTKDEAERLSLYDKLKTILPEVLLIKNPGGTKMWEDFMNLEKLRHRLIHLKSYDMKASGPEDKTIWGDLLRAQQIDFSKQAYELIKYYYGTTKLPRWIREFPYHK